MEEVEIVGNMKRPLHIFLLPREASSQSTEKNYKLERRNLDLDPGLAFSPFAKETKFKLVLILKLVEASAVEVCWQLGDTDKAGHSW